MDPPPSLAPPPNTDACEVAAGAAAVAPNILPPPLPKAEPPDCAPKTELLDCPPALPNADCPAPPKTELELVLGCPNTDGAAPKAEEL